MSRQPLKIRAAACIQFVITMSIVALVPRAVAKEPPKAELTLKDSSGQKVRLSDLRGKVVVLNFWATWCVPCNEEMPMLVQMEKEYSGRGVVFVGASLDDAKTRKQVPDFLSKYQVGFPIWYGASGDDLDKLGMGPAVPATAFLDPEGHIVARVMGEARPDEVKERLDWLTGDRTGTPPEAIVKHLEK